MSKDDVRVKMARIYENQQQIVNNVRDVVGEVENHVAMNNNNRNNQQEDMVKGCAQKHWARNPTAASRKSDNALYCLWTYSGPCAEMARKSYGWHAHGVEWRSPG